jgi:hypothetical protein
MQPENTGLVNPAPSQPFAPNLEDIRGKEYPAMAAPDSAKVEYIDKLHGMREADALATYKQATRNILYANNRQWLGWKREKRAWEELPLPDGDIRVTMNYIIVILRARVQRLVSTEINWRGIPESNAMDARDRVKTAVDVVQARYRLTEVEHKVRQALMQGAVAGFAALKSFWNPSIGPLTKATKIVPMPVLDPVTGTPVTDETGQVATEMQEVAVNAAGEPVQDESQAFYYRPGDTDTAVRTIFNIRMNAEAHGWTEAEGLRWLIDSEVVPLSVARERFPKLATSIRAMQRPESALNYERMVQASATAPIGAPFFSGPFMQTRGGAAQNESEMAVVREYWEMRSIFFPKGRLIVVVGGVVAYDGEWPQGVFPYAPIYGEPVLMSPNGRPVVNDLISPQDVINTEQTAIAKEMRSSGVGKYVAWEIPGVPDQLSRDDDQVVKIAPRTMLANRSIKDVFSKIEPAQVSPDRWRLIEQAMKVIFDLGAYHEVSRGQIPPGLDSGVAIQYLLEQESAQLKDAVEALKRSLILWARHQLAIAKWGYGENGERWIPVERPDLSYRLQAVNGTMLPDPETIGLDLEYFRPQSESAVRAEVKELLGMGLIDPRKAMQILDLGAGFDEAFASQSRHYHKARWENLDFESGNYVEVPGAPTVDPMTGAVVPGEPECVHVDGAPFYLPGVDDALIHIDVHNEIILDPTKPWELRRKVLLHNQKHIMDAQAMMAAAAMAQGGEGGEDEGSAPPDNSSGSSNTSQ